MQKTEHYQLNQWEPADRVLRTDFNEDNRKIDAALAKQLAAIAAAGNIRADILTYTGTGRDGTTSAPAVSITFPKPPILAVICNQSGSSGFLSGKNTCFHTFAPVSGSSISEGSCQCTWSSDGKQVSWYANYPNTALNLKDTTYVVYALSII